MPGLLATMHDDHARLDALIERLLDPVQANDPGGLVRVWGDFEHGLAAHLEAEEQCLLPGFERVDTAEAASIRSDHAKLRRLVAEVGAGIELQIVREHTVRQLVHFLRSHAVMEEQTLHRWADLRAPAQAKAAVVERLAEALHVRRRATDSRPDAPASGDSR